MAILPPQPPGIRLHFIVKLFFVARSARRFSCTDMRAEAATAHSSTLKTRIGKQLGETRRAGEVCAASRDLHLLALKAVLEEEHG